MLRACPFPAPCVHCLSGITHPAPTAAAGWSMYKGSVVEVEAVQPPHDATLREKESYDPWESVVVQWDRGKAKASMEL